MIPPLKLDDDRVREAALDTWRVYKRWAGMSREQKARRDRQKRLAFWLLLIAIVAGPLAARPAGPLSLPTSAREWALLVVTVIAGVAVALGAFLNEKIMGPKPDQEWVRAREGAEGLKSAVFELVMRSPPFDRDDPVVPFLARREQIESRLADLVAPMIPGGEAEAGFPGVPLSIDGYVAARADGQVAWLEKRVTEHLGRAMRLERAVQILGAAAAMLAVVGPLGVPRVGGWVPVITAVAAALTAQVSAGHHRFLSRSYQDAAARLRRSTVGWRASKRTGDDDARLVADCEATLREEQARWVQEMLNAGGPKPKGGAP